MYSVLRVSIFLLFTSLFGGCLAPKQSALQGASFGIPDSPNLEERWDMDQLTAHISLFNAAEIEGRASGSRGFLRAASYVSSELEAFGLQPIQVQNFRHQYASSVSVLERSSAELIGRDTLRLVQGEHFIAVREGASDSLLLLKKYRDLLSAGGYAFHPQVVRSKQITTSTMHISGMIPGMHPTERDSLVLIVAALDGNGLQGVTSYTGGTDLGLAASALLEVARRVSSMQLTWSFFRPTVMVSFLSGSLDEFEGPDSALRSLPWEKSHIKKVIVLEDSRTVPCDWLVLLSKNQITAPLTELTAADFTISEDDSMPFYPLVQRDQMIDVIGIPSLAQAAAKLAQQTMDAALKN